MMVEFIPETHKYLVDGVEVPSVTQIVAPLGEDFDEADDFVELAIEAAADRGVTMHAYIEHRLTGGAPEDFEIPDAYAPYADAVELFLSEHTVVPMLIETPLPGDGFAGTPDLVCEFDGNESILDYKFVSTISKARTGAQLAGYLNLCEANGVFPALLYAVQFLRTGDYRLYPVGVHNSTAAFEACREIYRLKRKKHPRGAIN